MCALHDCATVFKADHLNYYHEKLVVTLRDIRTFDIEIAIKLKPKNQSY